MHALQWTQFEPTPFHAAAVHAVWTQHLYVKIYVTNFPAVAHLCAPQPALSKKKNFWAWVENQSHIAYKECKLYIHLECYIILYLLFLPWPKQDIYNYIYITHTYIYNGLCTLNNVYMHASGCLWEQVVLGSSSLCIPIMGKHMVMVFIVC